MIDDADRDVEEAHLPVPAPGFLDGNSFANESAANVDEVASPSLAVLGLEEIGKVVLDSWERHEPLSKPIVRRTAHHRKQAAIGSLMLASFAVVEFGNMDDMVTLTDDLIERVSKAFHDSCEGKLLAHIQSGVLEKTKHVGIYQDDWLTAASLHFDQFKDADVTSIFDTARRAIAVLDNAQVMRTGRAIYETSP